MLKRTAWNQDDDGQPPTSFPNGTRTHMDRRALNRTGIGVVSPALSAGRLAGHSHEHPAALASARLRPWSRRGVPPSRAFLLGSLLVLAHAASPTLGAAELSFAPEDTIRWEAHAFVGTTSYTLVQRDGRSAIEAFCTQGTASGLFRRGRIDLRATPIVEWEWRVDSVLTGNNETSRSGDDYPARLYLVDDNPVLRWRTRAVNYVWSSAKGRGSDWPNAFAPQARMIAVADASDAGQGWRTERRNLREDFLRYHGREPERITTVAIMTDCDNTGQHARAWYGNIRFLPE